MPSRAAFTSPWSWYDRDPVGRGQLALLATHFMVVAAGLGLLGAGPALVNLLVAPWAEEIVLRLGLQEPLRRAWRRRRWPGEALGPVVACALAFALAHTALRPDAWSAATALPALAIGCVYARYRALAPCVVLHAFFNLLWFALAGPWLIPLFQ